MSSLSGAWSAAGGATIGLINTGTLRGTMLGAFQGFATFAIGKIGNFYANLGAHMMLGGLLEELNGGDFGHGMLSAGLSKAIGIGIDGLEGVSDPIKIVMQGIAGGAIAEAEGSGFANGAASFALQFALNQALNRIETQVPTYTEAKRHWQEGKGQPVRLFIEDIDWSDFDLEFAKSSPGIKRALSLDEYKDGDLIFVDYKGLSDNFSYKVPGRQYKTLGNITLKIEGVLERVKGGWKFDGELRAFDDLYNFNSDWSRPKRQIYTMGARLDHGPGTPYWFEIRGHMEMKFRWKDGQ